MTPHNKTGLDPLLLSLSHVRVIPPYTNGNGNYGSENADTDLSDMESYLLSHRFQDAITCLGRVNDYLTKQNIIDRSGSRTDKRIPEELGLIVTRYFNRLNKFVGYTQDMQSLEPHEKEGLLYCTLQN